MGIQMSCYGFYNHNHTMDRPPYAGVLTTTESNRYLSKIDKKADFIKMRLRWESDSYLVYLRNTSLLAMRHLETSTQVHKYALTESNLNPQPLTVTPQLPPDKLGVYEEFI